MGGLETGPRFSLKTGYCNLKKSALFFISFANALLLCHCYIFLMKMENGMCLKQESIWNKKEGALFKVTMPCFETETGPRFQTSRYSCRPAV